MYIVVKRPDGSKAYLTPLGLVEHGETGGTTITTFGDRKFDLLPPPEKVVQLIADRLSPKDNIKLTHGPDDSLFDRIFGSRGTR